MNKMALDLTGWRQIISRVVFIDMRPKKRLPRKQKKKGKKIKPDPVDDMFDGKYAIIFDGEGNEIDK